ncbi:phage portal protein family protein [Faecalibacter macacae]|uniref:DUF935 family protein n=1 Tax=Faecalibacter macacae TaxID=1859289 RepID=A0A3L9M5T2_9FLAO|nr:DUF935 family protein [Faecalibacter macacae]RLZ08587.1 hypothetical protein EAH69_09745 [Faecalibacter macacae]
MEFFKNIYQKAESYFLGRADESALRVAAVSKGGGISTSSQINYEAENMMSKSLKDWQTAIMLATDREEPNFADLSSLYNNLLLDNHLSSVIDTRILFCQRSPFKIVDEKGNENEELSYLFERTWFDDFVRLVLMSRFQGRTLIEAFDLNEEGELKEVNEIKQGYFNVKKGIITKEIGDTKGWPYREGNLQPYYLQVGKDYDLGMLAQMAPAILAKKLGMGAWQDYVDKFGVPPLFITTDRIDNNRLKELYNAAINYKRNNFMIGQGNEKFEVGNTGGVSSSDTFDLLVERVNSEVSKRVLGGAGLTDEKSFVGSTEAQMKLANDRFESDKLLVKNIINGEFRQKLIKLSPIYAPMQNHYFEWDNQEAMSKADMADLINKMSQNYIIDPEWAEQQTGVPIIGVREQMMTSTNQEQSNQNPADVKKK